MTETDTRTVPGQPVPSAMKVSDAMSTDVEFIDPDNPVCEAATLMGEIDVGSLPVGSAAALVGILTDRDILYRVVARGADCANVRVRDIVSTPVISCRDGDTLASAMDLMAANHIRRMPVLDDAGRVVGWITLADIARRLLVDSGELQSSLHHLTEAGS
jgi:CBS domain-containing protein